MYNGSPHFADLDFIYNNNKKIMFLGMFKLLAEKQEKKANLLVNKYKN